MVLSQCRQHRVNQRSELGFESESLQPSATSTQSEPVVWTGLWEWESTAVSHINTEWTSGLNWALTVRVYSRQPHQHRVNQWSELGFDSESLQPSATSTQSEPVVWTGLWQWESTGINHINTEWPSGLNWALTVRVYRHQPHQHRVTQWSELGFDSESLQPSATSTQSDPVVWTGLWQWESTAVSHINTE